MAWLWLIIAGSGVLGGGLRVRVQLTTQLSAALRKWRCNEASAKVKAILLERGAPAVRLRAESRESQREAKPDRETGDV